MHVKAEMLSVPVPKERGWEKGKGGRRIWENRLRNGGAWFGGCDTSFRVRATRICIAPATTIYLSERRTRMTRSSKRAAHRDTKDSNVACDKKEKAVSALARGNGGNRREERKKEGAKTARKRRSGGCRRSDDDSENARAKGYEMKFSSHPFCVSEGIPVRQEVPSRNRRKRKKNGGRERRKGRDRRRRRRRGMANGGGNGGGARPYGVAGYRTRRRVFTTGRSGGSKENCQQSSDCIVIPKGKVHRPLENLLIYGNRTHLPFTLLFTAQ